MDRAKKIIEELSELPKGYISKKKIKGKTYFYLQYPENGKLHSKYIPSSQVDGLMVLLSQREALEKELGDIRDSGSSLSKPSDRAKRFTGFLMVGDKVAAKFKEGMMTYIDENICPFYVKRTKNIERFLENRCLDLSRPNARVLLKFMGISNKNKAFVSLYSYGASISDNYWFKPSGSKKKYADVCFDNDLYSEIALNGGIPDFLKSGSLSPELTNIGSFEKCWKRMDDEWWMIKKGDEDQIFSELFSSKLASKLGIDTAEYEYYEGNIRTKNFASEYNFEPMYSLCDDDEDYSRVYKTLKGFGDDIADSYIALLFFDCLVYNVDRHNNNYGLLRDKKTGKIVSLAPNFDNNLSLLAYNKTLDQDTKRDGLIKIFVDFIRKNPDALSAFKRVTIEKIDASDVANVISQIPIERDADKITRFIISRYEYLIGIKNS